MLILCSITGISLSEETQYVLFDKLCIISLMICQHRRPTGDINNDYSKSPHTRTCFLKSHAEIGSFFKGTDTNFKVKRFLFEGCFA